MQPFWTASGPNGAKTVAAKIRGLRLLALEAGAKQTTLSNKQFRNAAGKRIKRVQSVSTVGVGRKFAVSLLSQLPP